TSRAGDSQEKITSGGRVTTKPLRNNSFQNDRETSADALPSPDRGIDGALVASTTVTAEEVPSAPVPVPASLADKLDDLRQRREAAWHAGSDRAVQRQHDKGKMLARERVEYLLDPDSFHELDLLARHRSAAAGLEEHPYTDGVITGWGTVDGRKVFV